MKFPKRNVQGIVANVERIRPNLSLLVVQDENPEKKGDLFPAYYFLGNINLREDQKVEVELDFRGLVYSRRFDNGISYRRARTVKPL